MLHRFVALALLACLTLFGASAFADVRLDESSFDAHTGRTLPLTGWRYRAGDDTAWASASFDDGDWTTLEPSLGALDETWQDIGWFRLALEVTPSLVDRPLLLWILSMGALEVYLDGVRIHALGDLDAARRGTEVAVRMEPESPTAVTFTRPGRHVLAVRFAAGDTRWVEQVRVPRLLQVFLGEPEQSTLFAKRIRRTSTLGPNLMAGGALVLSLLHLLLFYFYRTKQENLFYAALTMGMAAIGASTSQISHAGTLSEVTFFHSVFKAAVLVVSVFSLRFYYAVFVARVPVQFWVAAGVAALMTAFLHRLSVPAVYAFAIVTLLEGLRVLVGAWRRGQPGSRLIGAGGAVFAVCVFIQILPELFPGGQEPRLAYVYGFVALMVSMSAHLARGIAVANAELSLLRQLEVAHKELQATQANLVQSQKMASLGQLVAGVAHEINTPVGAIASAGDSIARGLGKLQKALLARDPKLAEDKDLARPLKALDDAAGVIASGSSRVSEIVKRLKRFARLDEAEWQSADLQIGLDDTLLLLQHELKHGVEVRRHYGEIPSITCLPSQLNQVFLNMFVNAVEAMSGKGVIEIVTRVDGGNVCVDIIDDGNGILPEHLSKIFDPGFTTKGVGVGTGLGLSICYRIVQAHHGEIRVESKAGAGARFTIVLPIEQSGVATAGQERA